MNKHIFTVKADWCIDQRVKLDTVDVGRVEVVRCRAHFGISPKSKSHQAHVCVKRTVSGTHIRFMTNPAFT